MLNLVLKDLIDSNVVALHFELTFHDRADCLRQAFYVSDESRLRRLGAINKWRLLAERKLDARRHHGPYQANELVVARMHSYIFGGNHNDQRGRDAVRAGKVGSVNSTLVEPGLRLRWALSVTSTEPEVACASGKVKTWLLLRVAPSKFTRSSGPAASISHSGSPISKADALAPRMTYLSRASNRNWFPSTK